MRIIISLILLSCCPLAMAAREEYKRDFQKAVALPGGSSLRVEHSLGNVEVITNDGDVTVVNGNGWVRASDITGTAEVTNRFGEVRISNVGKGLTVHGGNSRVDVEHVGGIAIVTSSFGDVRVWD